MATTKLSLETLAQELKVDPSDITDYLVSKGLTFAGLTDAQLPHVKTHFVKAAKMIPPAPPKMPTLNDVEIPMEPGTDLNSMSLEELQKFYETQKDNLDKAKLIAKITGDTSTLLNLQNITLEQELEVRRSEAMYAVKLESQNRLLGLSITKAQQVQSSLTSREITALEEYARLTLATPTPSEIATERAKKHQIAQTNQFTLVSNAIESEIKMMKSADKEDEEVITTINA